MSLLGDTVFNKTTVPVVKKMLDAAMLRTKAVSNNIANATTPGFRRVEVSFEKELAASLDRTRLQGFKTNSQHMALGKKNVSDVFPVSYRPNDPTLPSGVNNVDIDAEMSKLAEAQILYNYGVKFGQGAYKKINAAIQGRPIPVQ